MKHSSIAVLACLVVLPMTLHAAPTETPDTWGLPQVLPNGSPRGAVFKVVTPPDRKPIRRGLERREPLTCTDGEEITLAGILIDAPSDALIVKGNCRVFITRSHLRAGKHAIRVIGDGDVTLRDTTLEGTASALHISGDGSVNASATTFMGRIVELGNGDLVGLGKNIYDD